MAKYVELRRHTDADGDVLTLEGVRAAIEIGSRLEGRYEVLVSSGAQRATQKLACFLAGLGENVRRGVVVEPGLRSGAEDRWRAAYDQPGSGAPSAPRDRPGARRGRLRCARGWAASRPRRAPRRGSRARRRPQPNQRGRRFGLAGHMVEPISKGAGVLVVEENGAVRVEKLG